MLKLNEYFKTDERIELLFNRIRAELISKGFDEVWNHTTRVIRNLYLVHELFYFDFKIALISAICHDIGYVRKIKGHEKESAIYVKPILDDLYDSNTVSRIIHCIETHECEGDLRPVTPEALALHDADMLDFSGEMGVINAFVLGKSFKLSDASCARRILNVIEEGFLIKEVSEKYSSKLKKTVKFFTNLVNDLNKLNSDFKNFMGHII